MADIHSESVHYRLPGQQRAPCLVQSHPGMQAGIAPHRSPNMYVRACVCNVMHVANTGASCAITVQVLQTHGHAAWQTVIFECAPMPSYIELIRQRLGCSMPHDCDCGNLQVVAGTNYAFQFQAYFDCASQQGSGSFGSVTLDAIVFKPLENAKQNIIPPQVPSLAFLYFCLTIWWSVPHWEF